MSFYILILSALVAGAHQNSVDFAKCKVTHRGTEYSGRKFTTESNETCQHWTSSTEKGAKELKDKFFPDGSKRLAKNYCRNPNNAEGGPWCYTENHRLVKDFCNVSLCRVTDCRFTGPGAEYAGTISKSVSGRKCTKWRKNHELKRKKKEPNFKDKFFPDGSAFEAGNKCRNPSGNVNGPWCYVEKENSNLHEVELCDIPFCEDIDPIIYSANDGGVYSFYSSFNDSDSLKLGLRLWDEGDWSNGSVRVLISGVDVRGNRSEVVRWNAAIELLLSNAGSSISNGEEWDLVDTPEILSAVKWTVVEITWVTLENDVLLIQAFEDGKIKPFMLAELSLNNTLLRETSFRYFSISGSPSFWNVSSDDEECQIHTSPSMEFTRYWLMRKTTVGIDADVYVRAAAQAVFLFRVAPATDQHQVEVIIGDGEKVKVACYEGDRFTVVRETTWPNVLDFWRWENFKISFIKDRLQIYWTRPMGVELIMDVTHSQLSRVLWMSFGSPYTSYWAVYCDPRGVADPPRAAPPECIANDKDDFNGTQSVTVTGHQCIPWVDDVAIPPEYRKEKLFERYGGRAFCQNFCRNLDKDPKGPYCIVKDNSTGNYIREYCRPRSCHLGECKLAGTANDYTGHLNRTRSKRMCRTWTENSGEMYVDISNFPDPTLEDAGNYCRNPDKNVGGPWCFTSDPQVPKDFCFVRDCDKALECTVIASWFKAGHSVYIMPSWRKYGLHFWLKTWNPDIYEGLKIKFTSLTGDKSYILLIGDENNEKLKFSFADEEGEERLISYKTLLHLVPAGKWGGYWLRPEVGKIELGYHGVSTPFFEWTAQDEAETFDPAFLDFGTIQGHWIGVNFLCNECLLESTTSSNPSRIYPINLWNTNSSEDIPSNLVLHFRGTASVGILLMSSPDFDEYIAVKLSSDGEKISIWEYKWNWSNRKLVEYDSFGSFSAKQWTEYNLRFQEKTIALSQDNSEIFTWKSRRHLLFYWFSIKVYQGHVIWSANCPPADVDGPPRNGHWGAWGPWTCSASCGGGQGRTERKCDSPPPNVFGRECKGSSVYDGPCNTFRCGEISPGTYDKIRRHLASEYLSLEVEAGKKVVLPCNRDIRVVIMKEVKKMNVTWSLNGFPYSKRRARINQEYSLVIPKARERDSGVYLCIAHQGSDSVPSKVVIDVASLVVNRTASTKKVRQGGSFFVNCNGMALSYVYADLSQRWEIDERTWKDYGITSLETVSVDKVENVTNFHDGIWTCVVAQRDLGFKWKTNWMHVHVKSAPNFWTHLREDAATAPLFGKFSSDTAVKIVFSVITTVLIVIALLPIFFLVRYMMYKKDQEKSSSASS